MKTILRFTVLFGILVLLSAVARAADEPKSFYRDFEFSVDGFYQTATPDFEKETGSSGVGANVFFTRNFGIGASTALANLNGQFIDAVSLRGIYRVPIEKTALYGYAGSTRLFRAEDWTVDLGVGVEHRFTERLGPFLEAGMIKEVNGGANATGRVGLRINF